MPPSISIIIPTKNERKNLPRIFKSIPTDKSLIKEVIVVDNHSADGTLNIAQQVWAKTTHSNSPPLSLLTKGKERSQQRNTGAKKAQGKYLFFLDADMELPPTLLEKLQPLLQSGAKAVTFKEHAVGHDFWGKAVALEQNCYKNAKLLEAPRFVETETFKKMGGYDPSLIAGEDWDLCERLKNLGVKIIRTPAYLIHHETSGFLPNLKRKWYYAQHIQGYARKHPSRFAQQAGLKTRINFFWAARQKLLRQPIHTLGFLLLKTIIYFRWKLEPK